MKKRDLLQGGEEVNKEPGCVLEESANVDLSYMRFKAGIDNRQQSLIKEFGRDVVSKLLLVRIEGSSITSLKALENEISMHVIDDGCFSIACVKSVKELSE